MMEIIRGTAEQPPDLCIFGDIIECIGKRAFSDEQIAPAAIESLLFLISL